MPNTLSPRLLFENDSHLTYSCGIHFKEKPMPRPPYPSEEHDLPSVEAVLAGTLALMTGYSQALQAELHPEHRLLMGAKIGNNLGLLAEHPMLSVNFKRIVLGLQHRWMLMSACTAEAAPTRVCVVAADGPPQWH
jgi:hypothetical protein